MPSGPSAGELSAGELREKLIAMGLTHEYVNAEEIALSSRGQLKNEQEVLLLLAKNRLEIDSQPWARAKAAAEVAGHM